MSEKYTPGPWNLKSGVDFEYKHQIRDSEEKPVVFWPVYAGQTKKTAEANARLIAAAPDLLEACVYFEEFGNMMESRKKIASAIAKATGGGS